MKLLIKEKNKKVITTKKQIYGYEQCWYENSQCYETHAFGYVFRGCGSTMLPNACNFCTCISGPEQ